MLLENKTIIVTGASHGIGRAIAELCIKQGANVLCHGRDENALVDFKSIYPDSVEYCILDLKETDALNKITDTAIATFGAYHGLVNNAGIFPRTLWHEASEDLFDDIFDINTKAPLFLSQLAIQHFKEKNIQGSIVNIGSINAYCGQEDLLIYSMSKGALMTMTRNLADGVASLGIRVNQLNVGWTATETEIALKEKEGLGPDWQRRIPKIYAPRGEILKPEEVAPHVTFWLSDASKPVTSAIYEVEQYPVIGRNRISDLTL